MSTAINKLLNQIPRRAEAREETELKSTFEDLGVGIALDTIDHQILYGRRGTGKTHALKYMSSLRDADENIYVYIDFRTIGSLDSVVNPRESPVELRTAHLLRDVVSAIHEAILDRATDESNLQIGTGFVDAVDRLFDSVRTVVVKTSKIVTATEAVSEGRDASSFALSANMSGGASATLGMESSVSDVHKASNTTEGTEEYRLSFTEVGRAFREVMKEISPARLWVMFDEWAEMPGDIQPYMAEFIKRTLFPVERVTVKIAAIQQAATFTGEAEQGSRIGFELGADITANLTLDDFMVFGNSEDRASEFFKGLFYKHCTAGDIVRKFNVEIADPEDFVRQGFTDSRAFKELVRAAEGVPRDAINIAAKAALAAGDGSISVKNVRAAARQWFHNDKQAAIESQPRSYELLKWIVDMVIRNKKTRGFLVNEHDQKDSRLAKLFNARVLHLVKKGYSAQHLPGERFDVYTIDYGTYVDLMTTKNEPDLRLPFQIFDEEVDDSADVRAENVDVPDQDMRAVRSSILDLTEFGHRE